MDGIPESEEQAKYYSDYDYVLLPWVGYKLQTLHLSAAIDLSKMMVES